MRACIGILTPQPPTAPHWSDLWTYGVTPAALHLGLCAAAVAVWARAPWAADALAAALLAILVLAIRNAWDLVTWIAPMAKSDVK